MLWTHGPCKDTKGIAAGARAARAARRAQRQVWSTTHQTVVRHPTPCQACARPRARVPPLARLAYLLRNQKTLLGLSILGTKLSISVTYGTDESDAAHGAITSPS